MNWQEVFNLGRADAARHRRDADRARAGSADCLEQARAALDSDSQLLWLMRAMQQQSAAASSDAAAEISDRIADHAARILLLPSC